MRWERKLFWYFVKLNSIIQIAQSVKWLATMWTCGVWFLTLELAQVHIFVFFLSSLSCFSPCVGLKLRSFGLFSPMQQMQWFGVHVAITLIAWLLDAKITSILRIFLYFECWDIRIICPAIRYVFSFCFNFCLNVLVLCRTLYTEIYIGWCFVSENIRLGNLLWHETWM
jgi:hypothetical protein